MSERIPCCQVENRLGAREKAAQVLRQNDSSRGRQGEGQRQDPQTRGGLGGEDKNREADPGASVH